MTEPERPADAPVGSPTPEEISARLEALLKRTHAMRAEKAASPAPLSVTWPVSERELDHYEVVDVSKDHGTPARPASDSAAAPNDVAAPGVTTPVQPGVGEFARPDWSELRLRRVSDDATQGARWLPVLAALLALATLGQAAYIWYLHAAGAPAATGRLRVDGPEGAQVRVNGEVIGVAPVDRDLEPGAYDVQVAQGTGGGTQRVNIGRGSTVVLLPVERNTATPVAGNGAQPPPGTLPGTGAVPGALRGQGGAPAQRSTIPATVPAASARPTAAPGAGSPASAMGPAGVSATRGAVVIESTPPGLPVTMEGRERGVTPITIGQLKPGRHDVLVGGLARQVDVSANQVATLRVNRP